MYRLLGLAKRYGSGPTDTACGRALDLDVVAVAKIASMLERATENTPAPAPRAASGVVSARFARDPGEYKRAKPPWMTVIDGGAPGTLVTELMLKQVVQRQRPDGGAALLYPSGHVAVATAAAVTAVLVVRATLAPPRTRMRVAWLAGWLVVVIAAARLVQTVHYVTDVVGGAAIGLAVTGWVALAITAAQPTDDETW